MYSFDYSERFKEILKRLIKKDKLTYKQILKKIREIINSKNVEHYKNLRKPLQNLKRVHIGHFVLIFKFDKLNNLISFEDFDHHDKIYSK